MRLTRRRIIGLFVALLLIASGVGGALWKLTDPLRKQVEQILAEKYQGHFQFDGVGLHFAGGVEIRNLSLHADDRPDSEQLLAIERVDVYIPWQKLLAGEFTPRSVTLHQPTAHARIRDGQVHFPLPFRPDPTLKPPSVFVHQGSLRLTRDGTARSVENIWLELVPNDGLWTLSGQINDSDWSIWNLAGSFDQKHANLNARCANFAVTERIAEWLTAQQRETFQSFAPTGVSEVALQVSWAPESPLNWSLLVDPKEISLMVPGIPVPIEHLSGRIELGPRTLRVHRLIGNWGGGTMIVEGNLTKPGEASPGGGSSGGETDPVTMETAKSTNGEVTLGTTTIAGDFDVRVELRNLRVAELLDLPIHRDEFRDPHIEGVFQLKGDENPASWSGGFAGKIWAANFNGGTALNVNLRADEGRLHVEDLVVPWDQGLFRINGSAPLSLDGFGEGNIEVSDVDMGSFRGWIFKPESQIAGLMRGNLGFLFPIRRWNSLDHWELSGPGQMTECLFGKVRIDRIAGALTLSNRVLRLDEGAAALHGFNLTGALEIELRDENPLSARFDIVPRALSEMTKSNDGKLVGTLHAHGTLDGPLKPPKLLLKGTAETRDLEVSGRKIVTAPFDFQLIKNGFLFHDTAVGFHGGEAIVSGKFGWSPPGQVSRKHLQVMATVQDASAVSFWNEWIRSNPPVAGQVSGTFQLDIPIGDPSVPPAVTGELSAERAKILGVVARDVALESFQWSPDRFTVPKWHARIGAGRLEGSMRFNRRPQRPDLVVDFASKSDLRLHRLLEDFGLKQEHQFLKGLGQASGRIHYRIDTKELVGTGKIKTGAVGVAEKFRVDSFESRMSLESNHLRFHDWTATAYGGILGGSIDVDLSKSPRKRAEIAVTEMRNVQLRDVLERSPDLRKRVTAGTLSGRNTEPGIPIGRFFVLPGSGFSGSIDFNLRNAEINGLPVKIASGTLQTGPVDSRGEFVKINKPVESRHLLITLNTMEAADGFVWGNILVFFSNPTMYSTELRFGKLRADTLVRTLLNSDDRVSGRLGGRLLLTGTNRGFAQSNGKVDFWLNEAHLWEQPFVTLLARTIFLDRSISSAFHTARGAAQIRQGVFHFHDFRLDGDTARVDGSGTIELDGKIDFEVTGTVITPISKFSFLSPFTKAVDNIQQQLVRMRIGGTLKNPRRIIVPLPPVSKPASQLIRSGFFNRFRDSELRR